SELQPDGSVKVYNVSSTGQRTEIATIRNGVDGAKGQDGTNGRDGANGSSVVSELQPDGSVKVYNVSSTGQRTEIATIRNGVDGANGSSVVSELQPDDSVKVYNVSSTGQRTEIAIIRNGADGRDGKNSEVTVTPGTDQNGNPGQTITIVKPDGSRETTFVRDGKDGAKGQDGKNGVDGSSVTSERRPDGSVTVYNVSPTGERTEITTIRSGVDGKDGKDGKSPLVEQV
ncbi:TPA: hypothetical protein ACGO7U_002111, partial [Streptococcus suis]